MYAVRFLNSSDDAAAGWHGIFKISRVHRPRTIIVFDGEPPADSDAFRRFADMNEQLSGFDRFAIVAKWRNRRHFFRWVSAKGKVRGNWVVIGGELAA